MLPASKTLNNPSKFKGKRVLLRLDLNVPIVDREVRDDFRIQASLPTLGFLKDAGAKTIIISHIESTETNSLERIAKYLNGYYSLTFAKNFDALQEAMKVMRDGDIIMYENLRVDAGEKNNDPNFSKKLASLADIYVNDAFSVSHRSHASVVGIPKLLPSYAGLRLEKEVQVLSESLNPPRPALFVLGGAKFETKMPTVERFLQVADHVFIGGALSNDIYKEKGYEIGKSVVAKNVIQGFKSIIENPKVIIPTDVVTSSPNGSKTVKPNEVGENESILDAGPDTIAGIADLLSEVKYVLWNGPLGDYEKGFSRGTEDLARAIVESGAKSVVGGGDTIAVLAKAKMLSDFTFISTGGGAMLEFLAKGTLPGIEALKA